MDVRYFSPSNSLDDLLNIMSLPIDKQKEGIDLLDQKLEALIQVAGGHRSLLTTIRKSVSAKARRFHEPAHEEAPELPILDQAVS